MTRLLSEDYFKKFCVEYIPGDNVALYKAVKGKQVLITIGPARDE